LSGKGAEKKKNPSRTSGHGLTQKKRKMEKGGRTHGEENVEKYRKFQLIDCSKKCRTYMTLNNNVHGAGDSYECDEGEKDFGKMRKKDQN